MVGLVEWSLLVRGGDRWKDFYDEFPDDPAQFPSDGDVDFAGGL